MRVAIRADASVEIGSGHVMRCLALAAELQRQGAAVDFLCRDLPESLAGLVTAQGHGLQRLPPRADWQTDAADTAARLEAGCDWLVVDHYGLGRDWEAAMRGPAARLMAIDDLGREHDCDLLLDPNSDQPERYAGRLPEACVSLLGPRHALLRAEFAALRAAARPRDGHIGRLLVAFGGGDAGGETLKVLTALAELRRGGLALDVALDVVIAAIHPRRAEVEVACGALSGCALHVDTPAMAGLMHSADLALGAGGGMAWERCCLGLPALVASIADNQVSGTRALARAGALLYLGEAARLTAGDWRQALAAVLAMPEWVAHLSAQAASLVDGQGAARVARHLLAADLVLRPATAVDAEAVHAWRNHPEVRAAAFDSAPILLATHRQWFAASLADPARVLLIGEEAGRAIGVLRYDLAEAAASVSIYLAPGCAGRGLGRQLLRAGEDWLRARHPEINAICAEIRAGNEASLRAFAAAGFVPERMAYVRKLHDPH